VGKDGVSEHKVGKEGAPNSELTAKNNLVECMLAQENSVEQAQHPESQADD